MGILNIFKKTKETNNIEWNALKNEQDLEQITNASFQKKQLIFKHSTSCSISKMALNRVESSWNLSEDIEPHYLDLLNLKPLSAKIANTFNVIHESPQVLIIENGKCMYHTSHNGINVQSIKQIL